MILVFYFQISLPNVILTWAMNNFPLSYLQIFFIKILILMRKEGNKIAMIEDDDISILIGKKVVEESNKSLSFYGFNSARGAIEVYDEEQDGRPDILFVDINMPLMNAWKFLDEFNLRNQGVNSETTICMLSDFINPEDMRKFNEKKIASLFFSKPFTTECLEIAWYYDLNFRTISSTGNT